ncbi:hypothetical protein B484DRAFT_448106 [Ochromonadaceae sp. CCMP2298]|nr:hypothetical protein B484DRAFT_448106 [Ochromonadaceae sp. CCMP2298]
MEAAVGGLKGELDKAVDAAAEEAKTSAAQVAALHRQIGEQQGQIGQLKQQQEQSREQQAQSGEKIGQQQRRIEDLAKHNKDLEKKIREGQGREKEARNAIEDLDSRRKVAEEDCERMASEHEGEAQELLELKAALGTLNEQYNKKRKVEQR